MTPEYAIAAAIRDMQTGKEQPHCGPVPSHISADEPFNNIEWRADYAEPGYDKGEHGILFANWNHYPSRLTDILERMGYAIEWSDEWAQCDDCNRAVRTSGDSYGWRRFYYMPDDDCTILCADCALENIE